MFERIKRNYPSCQEKKIAIKFGGNIHVQNGVTLVILDDIPISCIFTLGLVPIGKY